MHGRDEGTTHGSLQPSPLFTNTLCFTTTLMHPWLMCMMNFQRLCRENRYRMDIPHLQPLLRIAISVFSLLFSDTPNLYVMHTRLSGCRYISTSLVSADHDQIIWLSELSSSKSTLLYACVIWYFRMQSITWSRHRGLRRCYALLNKSALCDDCFARINSSQLK